MRMYASLRFSVLPKSNFCFLHVIILLTIFPTHVPTYVVPSNSTRRIANIPRVS